MRGLGEDLVRVVRRAGEEALERFDSSCGLDFLISDKGCESSGIEGFEIDAVLRGDLHSEAKDDRLAVQQGGNMLLKLGFYDGRITLRKRRVFPDGVIDDMWLGPASEQAQDFLTFLHGSLIIGGELDEAKHVLLSSDAVAGVDEATHHHGGDLSAAIVTVSYTHLTLPTILLV